METEEYQERLESSLYNLIKEHMLWDPEDDSPKYLVFNIGDIRIELPGVTKDTQFETTPLYQLVEENEGDRFELTEEEIELLYIDAEASIAFAQKRFEKADGKARDFMAVNRCAYRALRNYRLLEAYTSKDVTDGKATASLYRELSHKKWENPACAKLLVQREAHIAQRRYDEADRVLGVINKNQDKYANGR